MCRRSEASERMKMRTTTSMFQHVYSDKLWHCLCHSRTTTFRVSGPSASRSTSAIATSPTSQHVTLSNMLSTSWGHTYVCPCVSVCSFLRRTRDKFIIIGLTQYIARSACCERSRFESSTARATYQFIVCYRHFADTCRRYGGG